MDKHSKAKAFVFLLAYRWLTLVNALIISWPGAKTTPLLLVSLVFIYNLTLSIFPLSIFRKLKDMPLLLSIDLIFCATVIYLSGGWASPYFMYSFSPLLMAALLFKFRGALCSAAVFSVLYAVTLYLNDYSIAVIAEIGRLDSLISNFVSFFLASIFFAYPASLLEQLENRKTETELAKADLGKTHNKLETAYKLVSLSKREMEVLHLVSEGKTNKDIADMLYLAESTVKTHVSNILKKLGLKSRAEVIAYFFKADNTVEQ